MNLAKPNFPNWNPVARPTHLSLKTQQIPPQVVNIIIHIHNFNTYSFSSLRALLKNHFLSAAFSNSSTMVESIAAFLCVPLVFDKKYLLHNALHFHPCCCKGYKLLLSLCCVEFHNNNKIFFKKNKHITSHKKGVPIESIYYKKL